MPEIQINNLKVGYLNNKQEIIVLDDFNATFHDASFSVIIGDSGCGKTTLLKTIVGFYNYEGKILFDGVDISNTKVPDRNISLVSQNYALYPHLTVFDNIAFPLKVLKTPREEIVERVYQIAKDFHIEECLTRKPKVLSGGQLQRVALARALIKRPSVALFDEPLSNLDPKIASEIRILLKNTIKKLGSTVIYVTHNIADAFAMADEIFIIKDGQIKLQGTPKKLSMSKNKLIKSYLDAK